MRTKILLIMLLASIIAPFVYINGVEGFLLVKAMFVFMASLALTHAFFYIKENDGIIRKNDNKLNKILNNYIFGIVLILICVIISMYPVISKSCLVGDDMLEFSTRNNLWTGMTQLRPLGAVLFDKYSLNEYEFYNIPKIISLAHLYIFALLLHKWLLKKTQNPGFSLVVTIVSVCNSILADVVNYILLYPNILSLILGSISIICYDKVENKEVNNKYEKIFYLCSSVIMLLFAYMSSQLITSIVFVFIAIAVFNKRQKNKFRYTFKYMIGYAMVTLVYVAFSKGLLLFYNMYDYMTLRGKVINNLELIYPNIIYILNKGIVRINAMFLENKNIYEKILLYSLNTIYERRWIDGITASIIILGIVFTAIKFLKDNKKERINVIQLIALIPFTFWARIVLEGTREGYSYYDIPLTILLIYYTMEGMNFVVENIKTYKKVLASILIILFVLFQSYNYAENKVVKPHRAGYYFLKNEMEKNLGKTSKFHVVGKLGGTAMEWQSREMMKFILIRKGLKWQEYSLTGSVQKDIVSFIDIFYYKDRIIKSITKEEQALIDKYYDKREPFNGYYYKYIPIEEEDREKLNKIFIKYDLIPAEDFVTIDLHDCAELAEVQEVF